VSQEGATGAQRDAPQPCSQGQRGATTVEFAFAMLFVFFMFIAFYQTIMIFLAHERASYAAFVASRAWQVQGNPAVAAQFVDPALAVTTKGETLRVEKDIAVPLDFRNLFSGHAIRTGGAWFTVSQEIKTFREPRNPGGDN